MALPLPLADGGRTEWLRGKGRHCSMYSTGVDTSVEDARHTMFVDRLRKHPGVSS